MDVAKPQPALPKAGIGPKPYIKIMLSGIKTTKASKLMTVTGRGWPNASNSLGALHTWLQRAYPNQLHVRINWL